MNSWPGSSPSKSGKSITISSPMALGDKQKSGKSMSMQRPWGSAAACFCPQLTMEERWI